VEETVPLGSLQPVVSLVFASHPDGAPNTGARFCAPIVRALRAYLDWLWVMLLAQISWVTVERWGRAWRDRKLLAVGRV